jgi:hypothetical protein
MEILFYKSNSNKNSQNIIEKFFYKKNVLTELKTIEIIEAFDEISRYWISKKCGIKNLIRDLEIGFIIPWTKKSNLKRLINLNFNNPKYLDEPLYDNKFNSIIYGRPLGLAVHWVAGNIPLLAVISLFQSLLTKNKSIVKVPSNLKEVLPQILIDLKKTNFFKRKNKKIINDLLESTLVIHIEKNDTKSQTQLSKSADIRIVWGGMEAVDNIIGLPKKINCRDIIFGPKVSLAFVSKEKLKSHSNLKKLSKNLSDDVFTFNQTGCNSPHNLIVESGSNFDLEDIAKKIAHEFNSRSRNKSYFSDPIDKYNILEKKFIFQSEKERKVFSGNKNEWNIFVDNSNNIKIEDPIYCRSIFLTKAKNLNKLGNSLPSNTQSLGLFVSEKRKKEIIKIFSNYGIDRFPDIGKMSLYENPWDGYLPLQQMVKWISSN